jgi:hypothetical protein
LKPAAGVFQRVAQELLTVRPNRSAFQVDASGSRRRSGGRLKVFIDKGWLA